MPIEVSLYFSTNIDHRATLSESAALIALRLVILGRKTDNGGELDTSKSGSFKSMVTLKIHRLGFGAMRITGPRVWGPPLEADPR